MPGDQAVVVIVLTNFWVDNLGGLPKTASADRARSQQREVTLETTQPHIIAAWRY
jgi:hypothetical protein